MLQALADSTRFYLIGGGGCPEVVEEETGVLPAPPFPSPCPGTAGAGLRKRRQCFRIDPVAFLAVPDGVFIERGPLFGDSAEDHSTEPAVTNGKGIAPTRHRVPVPVQRVGGRKWPRPEERRTTAWMKPLRINPFSRNRVFGPAATGNPSHSACCRWAARRQRSHPPLPPARPRPST